MIEVFGTIADREDASVARLEKLVNSDAVRYRKPRIVREFRIRLNSDPNHDQVRSAFGAILQNHFADAAFATGDLANLGRQQDLDATLGVRALKEFRHNGRDHARQQARQHFDYGDHLAEYGGRSGNLKAYKASTDDHDSIRCFEALLDFTGFGNCTQVADTLKFSAADRKFPITGEIGRAHV